MFKKILMWSIYVGVVGLLIFGAVIRTEAKTEGNVSQTEERLERGGSDHSVQGAGGADRSGEEGQGAGRFGEESGRNENSTGSGDEVHLAEDEDHDWTSLTGIVSSLDSESLWIEISENASLEITGRAWRFIQEEGFTVSVGDQLNLEGFYEDGEFEVSEIQDLTTGKDLMIREESGRPLWSGGGGH